ncbi:MAG: ABC transporter ATP-binding protein [Pseudonocardia sp.]
MTATTDARPERAAEGGRPILRLVPMVAAHPVVFVLTVASILFHQVCSIGAVAVGALVVGQVASGADAGSVHVLLVVLAALVIGRSAGHWAEIWIAHDLAFRILIDIRMRVYDGVERTAPGGVLRRRTGDLAAGALSDVETLEWFFAHTLGNLIAAVAVPVAALAVLGSLHAGLALVLLPALLVVALAPFTLRRLADRQGAELKEQLATVNAEVVDGVQGLKELVVFGRGDDHVARLRRHARLLHRSQLRFGQRAGVESGIAELALAVGTVAVLALGAVLVADGTIPFAVYPPAIVLAVYAFVPLTEVAVPLRMLGQIRASARRVRAIAEAPPNVHDPADDPPVRLPRPPFALSFQDVCFAYRAGGPLALRDVSFDVPAGATVALVGHSGSGKTTCANLLLRFWDPTSGTVRIGGVDAATMPAERLRDLVALVPQDVYLFNDTIRANILLGRPDATAAEMAEAIDRAQVAEFLPELPDGLDTLVGERGATLSGGQRQRVAIARALLKDAPVLIMDEAVSNLDTENEQALRAAMAEVRRGRTTLLIAHRLSTIRSTDLVVTLDAGRVAEVGGYDELVRAGGTFARLVAGQRNLLDR